jgi:hypothetical protein
VRVLGAEARLGGLEGALELAGRRRRCRLSSRRFRPRLPSANTTCGWSAPRPRCGRRSRPRTAGSAVCCSPSDRAGDAEVVDVVAAQPAALVVALDAGDQPLGRSARQQDVMGALQRARGRSRGGWRCIAADRRGRWRAQAQAVGELGVGGSGCWPASLSRLPRRRRPRRARAVVDAVQVDARHELEAARRLPGDSWAWASARCCGSATRFASAGSSGRATASASARVSPQMATGGQGGRGGRGVADDVASACCKIPTRRRGWRGAGRGRRCACRRGGSRARPPRARGRRRRACRRGHLRVGVEARAGRGSRCPRRRARRWRAGRRGWRSRWPRPTARRARRGPRRRGPRGWSRWRGPG